MHKCNNPITANPKAVIINFAGVERRPLPQHNSNGNMLQQRARRVHAGTVILVIQVLPCLQTALYHKV
jgi:hypothetical protein